MAKTTLAAATTATNLFNQNNETNGNGLMQDIYKFLYNYNNNNATFSIDGNTTVTRKKTKNGITTNYKLSDDEKSLLDYTNKNILEGLKNINVFSDEVQKSIKNQVDAYKAQGLRELNDTYTPMFKELKTDIASRFGNLDNSIFLDNLNEIERNRTNALATLTENILAKQNKLYETELSNRYNYLSALTQANESIYTKILNYLNLAGS